MNRLCLGIQLSIINYELIIKDSVSSLSPREFFCSASTSSNAARRYCHLNKTRDAGVCFILIIRSGVEEMKSEQERKRGATRNWRNYDFKRLSPCPLPILPVCLLSSEREKEGVQKVPLSPFASPKLPRFTTESQL